jgi:hypothetical protein
MSKVDERVCLAIQRDLLRSFAEQGVPLYGLGFLILISEPVDGDPNRARMHTGCYNLSGAQATDMLGAAIKAIKEAPVRVEYIHATPPKVKA